MTSTLYPPIVRGGYEMECSAVVDRLRERHDVLVLTSELERGDAPVRPDVRRELALIPATARGSLRAPRASWRAVASARRALAWRPDLVYAWNGANIPQASLRVLADSGTPIAFRVCEHWFGRMFLADQFLRELLPDERDVARGAWALGCRAVNRLPGLGLDPSGRFAAAVSWNSAAIQRMSGVPPTVVPVLERIGHSVPRHGDRFAAVVRDPAPEPEIVYVGRVTPYKGIRTAIEALAELRSRHGVRVRLVVAGPEDVDHGAEMRALASRLGVAEQVTWLGQIAPERLAERLGRAAALIVPSVWEEPFPLVTIEGALARVPLVAADVGGVSEGMHDEEHALLYPRGDAASAAAALARTLRDRDETAARVARAFERAQQFRLVPYLDEQERFVEDAYAALTSGHAAVQVPASAADTSRRP